MREVVLASDNQGKLLELQAFLDEKDVELIPQSEFNVSDVAETGLSFVENALIKARHACTETMLPSIADDSGIEVDALNGEPGVFSSRYAGENCSYLDNLNKILENMLKIPLDLRGAQYKTVMAFVSEKMELFSEGSVKGLITKEPKGIGGFGYDPVFYIPEMIKTFSEMTIE